MPDTDTLAPPRRPPTPPLPKVHLTAEARVDIDVDLVAFFRQIGEDRTRRAAYITWTACPECGDGDEGCIPAVKPWHFLLDEFAQNITVDSGFLPVRAGGVVVNDRTDVDDIEGSFDRPGDWRERQFEQADYDALLAAVPWLAPLDTADGELAAEIARTTPGPYDQPLPFDAPEDRPMPDTPAARYHPLPDDATADHELTPTPEDPHECVGCREKRAALDDVARLADAARAAGTTAPPLDAKVRTIAERAIADRLGHPMSEAVIEVRADAGDDDAVVLHVNSGGNAIVCEEALMRAGYEVIPIPTPAYGVLLGVRPRPDRSAPEVVCGGATPDGPCGLRAGHPTGPDLPGFGGHVDQATVDRLDAYTEEPPDGAVYTCPRCGWTCVLPGDDLAGDEDAVAVRIAHECPAPLAGLPPEVQARAAAGLAQHFGEAAAHALTYDKDPASLRGELLDVLAVASAWVAAIDRAAGAPR